MSIPLANPIPGQSLTREPKSVPWEQPPHKPNPLDALQYHIDYLNDDEVMDNLLDMLDMMVPVEVVASTQLSKGVMDGIHTVDVKGLLLPIVASIIEGIAVSAGVDYILTYEDLLEKDEEETIERMKLKMMAKIEKSSAEEGADDPGVQLMQQTVETLEEDTTDVTEEPVMEEPMGEEQEEPMPAQAGLMAKGA